MLAAVEARLFDLLKLVRAHCYHPAFHGSLSLKNVVPVLVPGLGYDDLEIADGPSAGASTNAPKPIATTWNANKSSPTPAPTANATLWQTLELRKALAELV